MTVSDDFNRPDGGLGAAWGVRTGAGAVVSNRFQDTTDDGPTGYYAVYETDVGSVDMYCRLRALSSPQVSNGSNVGPAVRHRSGSVIGDVSGYQFASNFGTAQALWRTNAGTETNISNFTATVASSDLLQLEAAGRLIRAKVNGALVHLFQDTSGSLVSTGQRGCINGYNADNADVVIADDFVAGPLTDLAAPYLVDWGAQTARSTAASMTPAYPVTPAAGDLVLAHGTIRSTTETITPPANEGWVQIELASGNSLRGYLWGKIWGLGGGQVDDTTPTFGRTGTTGAFVTPAGIIRNPKHATAPWTSVAAAVVASGQQSNAASATVTAPSVTHTGVNRTLVRLFASADDNALNAASEGLLVWGGAAYDATDIAAAMSILEDVTVTTSTGTATVTESVNGTDASNGITLVLAVPDPPPNQGTADLALTVALAAVGSTPHQGTAGLGAGVALAATGVAPVDVLSVLWVPGDEDRFTRHVLTQDGASAYELDTDTGRGRFTNPTGGAAWQTNQREAWTLEDSGGLDEHIRSELYSGPAFGNIPELGGTVNPQHGMAFRIGESGGRRSLITVDNNVAFGVQWALNASVWSSDLDGANFRNRQTTVPFESLIQTGTVTAIARAGNTVTATLTSSSRWRAGDRVNLNVSVSSFNRPVVVTSAVRGAGNSWTLTWAQTGSDESGGTGTITKVFPYDAETRINPPGSNLVEVRAKRVDAPEFPDWVSFDPTAGVHTASAPANAILTTPHDAALAITGPICVIVDLTLPNWHPTVGNDPLAAKRPASGNAAWLFTLQNGAPSGRLEWFWSANGTTLLGPLTSTAANPFTNGNRGAVAVVFLPDNGASGRTATFYTAPTYRGPWTQLGSPVTTAGASSIFNATNAAVEIGSQQNGTNSLRRIQAGARIHAAQIRNAGSLTGGTAVLDVFVPNQYTGQTSFTDRAGRAITVTSPGAVVNAGMPEPPATALRFACDLDEAGSETARLTDNPTPTDTERPMGLVAAHLGSDPVSAAVFGRSTFGEFEVLDGAADLPVTLALAAVGSAPHQGTADLALQVTLSAEGAAGHQGAAALALEVALAADGATPHRGAAGMPVGVALGAEGATDHQATADLPLTVALAGQGTTGHAATGDLAVGVALGAAGAADRSGAADLGVQLALTAGGDTGHTGTAELGLAVGLAAAGAAGHTGQAGLALQLALDAVGVAPEEGHAAGTAELDLTLGLAAQGGAGHTGTADLPVTVELTAAGNAPTGGTGDLALGVGLAAVGAATHTGTGDLPLTVALAAAGTAPHQGTADLALEVVLAGFGVRRARGAAGTPTAVDLDATGDTPHQGTATLGVDLALDAAGQTDHAGTADLALTTGLTAVGTAPDAKGTAALDLHLTLAAVGHAPPHGAPPAAGCPWPIDLTCCTGLSPDQQQPAVVARWQNVATTLLWGASGRRWGPCRDVIARPCARACAEALFGPSVTWGAYGGRWLPYTRGGRWYNASLCGCTGACACTELSEVYLEGPVFDIREVWVDGTQLAPEAYQVHHTDRGTMLVRTGGQAWPACSDPAAPCDGPGSFCVLYRIGLPLDDAAIAAVSEMTCELIKASCGGTGCRLPANAQRVVRQGVTVELDTADGLFELPLVKAWLDTVNPGRLPAPPRVYSTNVRRPRVTPFR